MENHRHDKTAEVISADWSGIRSETWDVTVKTPENLILVKTDRESIRTITINAKYATFVHCFNGNLFGANHGATFWGKCSNF